MFLGRKGAQKTGLNDGATLAAAKVNPQLRWITVVIKYFPASARLPFFAINISTNIYRRFESYVSNREKCSLSSTPGPDHISWRHLKSLITNDRCLLKIVQITNACIDLEFWPSHFKSSNRVVIPKPNKNNYNSPKSFRPIILLNTMGKLIEKAISNRLQFHLSANGFLNSHQFGGIRQRSTTDTGIYLTHLIRAGWLRQCHTSVLTFDIAQFFPSLNHQFLSLCLKKASLNTNVIGFFNSYHSNHSTSYSWNSFTSPPFNVNVGIGQGSALSPILSALYLAPIIKTFQKELKTSIKKFLQTFSHLLTIVS